MVTGLWLAGFITGFLSCIGISALLLLFLIATAPRGEDSW